MSGRPRFEPTPEQRKLALGLARVAASDREIAKSLRIDVKTLRRSDLGGQVHDVRMKLKVKLLRALIKKAMPERDDEYRRYGDVGPLLKRLDAAGASDEGAEIEPEIDQNQRENDGKE